MASVYLRSRSGRSLLREPAPIDPEPFLAAPEKVETVARALERLGFAIEGRGVTLSISGHPDLFEQTCGVRLRAAAAGGWISSQPLMRIPGLQDLIEGMVVAVPGVPF